MKVICDKCDDIFDFNENTKYWVSKDYWRGCDMDNDSACIDTICPNCGHEMGGCGNYENE